MAYPHLQYVGEDSQLRYLLYPKSLAHLELDISPVAI